MFSKNAKEGEIGSYCLMNAEFQFCRLKTFWR